VTNFVHEANAINQYITACDRETSLTRDVTKSLPMLVGQAVADDIDLLTEIQYLSASPMKNLAGRELAISVEKWLKVRPISPSPTSPQRSSQ